jgi:hypothetical protein
MVRVFISALASTGAVKTIIVAANTAMTMANPSRLKPFSMT